MLLYRVFEPVNLMVILLQQSTFRRFAAKYITVVKLLCIDFFGLLPE